MFLIYCIVCDTVESWFSLFISKSIHYLWWQLLFSEILKIEYNQVPNSATMPITWSHKASQGFSSYPEDYIPNCYVQGISRFVPVVPIGILYHTLCLSESCFIPIRNPLPYSLFIPWFQPLPNIPFHQAKTIRERWTYLLTLKTSGEFHPLIISSDAIIYCQLCSVIKIW